MHRAGLRARDRALYGQAEELLEQDDDLGERPEEQKEHATRQGAHDPGGEPQKGPCRNGRRDADQAGDDPGREERP